MARGVVNAWRARWPLLVRIHRAATACQHFSSLELWRPSRLRYGLMPILARRFALAGASLESSSARQLRLVVLPGAAPWVLVVRKGRQGLQGGPEHGQEHGSGAWVLT